MSVNVICEVLERVLDKYTIGIQIVGIFKYFFYTIYIIDVKPAARSF